MNKCNTILSALSSVLLLGFSSVTVADGLTDLQVALTELTGKVPVSAQLESAFTQNSGKKKKMKTSSGFIQMQITDDNNGLQINYSSETLNNLEKEANAKEVDEETNTPTLNAINDIEANALRNMLSAAGSISRSLKKAEFVDEQAIESDGEAIRVLNFSLPLEAIIDNEDVRGYVDDFNGKYTITIDEKGNPLSTELSFEGSGRAYIFFSLEIRQTKTANYVVVGNRLIKIREEFDRKQSSTWGKRDSSGYKALTLKPSDELIALRQE